MHDPLDDIHNQMAKATWWVTVYSSLFLIIKKRYHRNIPHRNNRTEGSETVKKQKKRSKRKSVTKGCGELIQCIFNELTRLLAVEKCELKETANRFGSSASIERAEVFNIPNILLLIFVVFLWCFCV